MQKKILKVGLIGLGRMGQTHCRNIHHYIPGAKLVAVADAVYDKNKFNEQYPGVSFSDSDSDVMQSDEIDTVVISTPTSTHADLIKKAISRQKNIFCEKPLDLSLEVTTEVIRLAENKGIKLMFGFNRRFDNDFAQLRKSVLAGKIGNPQIIKITNRDPDIPPVDFIRNSGGMFMDFSIHDFDMARYVMGKKVVEVVARGLVFIDKAVGEAGDIDTALITLTFEDGTYAVIDNSRKAVYGYDQRLEIFGDAGMILVENNLYNQNIIYDANGIHSALPLNNFTERYKQSYLSEMKSFVDAVLNNKELPVSGEDMITATAIAYASRKSMKEGRAVSMAEIENTF